MCSYQQSMSCGNWFMYHEQYDTNTKFSVECVVNRSQSNMKFKSSGLHAFGWQVYSGMKINKEGTVHLSLILRRNVLTLRKATSMASVSNGRQWSWIRLPPFAFKEIFFSYSFHRKLFVHHGRSGFGGRDKQPSTYRVIKPGNPARMVSRRY